MKNRILLALIGIVTALTSWAQRDTVALCRLTDGIDNGSIYFTLYIDYPTSGGEALKQSIREYISEQLGGTYEGSLADSTALRQHYTEQYRDSLRRVAAATAADSSIMPVFMNIEISACAETDKFITYSCTKNWDYHWLHGFYSSDYQTFRKSDGRRFGWEMFREKDSPRLNALLRDSLKAALEAESDSALQAIVSEAYTTDSVLMVPLPAMKPAFTTDGLLFVYQLYEIVPYAYGAPEVLISYDKLRDLLTVPARQLLPALPSTLPASPTRREEQSR